MQIHGKEYTEVKDRIREFMQKYPNGSIETILMVPGDADKKALFRAEVTPNVDNAHRIFTGYAYEERSNSTNEVNATSWIENCETSAIGRALANMDIGVSITGTRPSAEEIQKAERAKTAIPATNQDVETPAKMTAIPKKILPLKGSIKASTGRETLVSGISELAAQQKSIIGHDALFQQILENHKISSVGEEWKNEATLTSLETIMGTLQGVSTYLKTHEIVKFSDLTEENKNLHYGNLKKLTLF